MKFHSLRKKRNMEKDEIVVNMSQEEYEIYVKWVETGRRLMISKLPPEEQKVIRCQKVKEYYERKKAEDPDEFRRLQAEKKRAYRAKLKAQKV
jgi:hypothetical protein